MSSSRLQHIVLFVTALLVPASAAADPRLGPASPNAAQSLQNRAGAASRQLDRLEAVSLYLGQKSDRSATGVPSSAFLAARTAISERRAAVDHQYDVALRPFTVSQPATGADRYVTPRGGELKQLATVIVGKTGPYAMPVAQTIARHAESNVTEHRQALDQARAKLATAPADAHLRHEAARASYFYKQALGTARTSQALVRQVGKQTTVGK